jgi:hypothetical protein
MKDYTTLKNVNRGIPYENRVCIGCKGTPAELSNYCEECYSIFKSQLIEWSTSNFVSKVHQTKLKDLVGKKLTVKNLHTDFGLDLEDEETGVVYSISPIEHKLQLSFACSCN